jgi:hypothetical protein
MYENKMLTPYPTSLGKKFQENCNDKEQCFMRGGNFTYTLSHHYSAISIYISNYCIRNEIGVFIDDYFWNGLRIMK